MPTRTGRRLFVFSVFLFWLAHYIYMPTLPEYLWSKTGSLVQVGTVLSMYGLWQAIVRFPLGRLVDLVGRRKLFILCGTALAGIGALALWWASGYGGLIVARSLVGVSMGTWVLQVVVFSAFYPPGEAVRAGAILTLVTSLAKLLGTSATGFLNSLGGYALAFYVSGSSIALALLMLLPLADPAPAVTATRSGVLRHLLRKKTVTIPSVMAIINQFINFSVTFGFLPILAGQLGADDVVKSMLVSTNIAALILGNLLLTTFAKKTHPVHLLIVSFGLFTVGVAGTALAPRLGWLFVLQSLLGLAHGIGYPTLIGLTIREVEQGQRATAMGLHQTVYALGMFAGPGLSGLLADRTGIRFTFAVIAAGCLLSSAVLIWRLTPRK
jgi:MFS family permease